MPTRLGQLDKGHPFVKIVVSGNVVVGCDFRSAQPVCRIQRIGKPKGGGAPPGRQQRAGCQSQPAGSQKLAPAKVPGMSSNGRVRQLPGMLIQDIHKRLADPKTQSPGSRPRETIRLYSEMRPPSLIPGAFADIALLCGKGFQYATNGGSDDVAQSIRVLRTRKIHLGPAAPQKFTVSWIEDVYNHKANRTFSRLFRGGKF